MLGKQIGWPYSTDQSLVDAHLAAVDERDVGAGAAHVEPDGVLVAAEAREALAGDRARGDARGGEAHGVLLHQRLGHDAAAGVQQQQIALVAALLQPLAESLDVAADQR